MTRDEDAVKGLLGKAFGQEPPLTLDREEIFRRGRRGVRIRRFAASGGVAAAVFAVVLGAAALSNLPGDGSGPDITPAQGTTTQQPPYPSTLAPASTVPAPQLPLSTTTLSPPSVVGVSDVRAAELTRILSKSGLLSGTLNAFPAEPSTTPLTFKVSGGSYRASAQLSDAKGQGILIIAVRSATDSAIPRCPNLTDCAEVQEAGVAMAARTDKNNSGFVEYSVIARRPDGTGLTLIANNMASTRPDETRTTRPLPPVTLDQLRAIATMPGFSFG